MKKIIIIALVAISTQIKAQTNNHIIVNADEAKIAQMRAQIKQEESQPQAPIVLNPVRVADPVANPNADGRGSSANQTPAAQVVNKNPGQQQLDVLNAAKAKAVVNDEELKNRIKVTNESGKPERR